MVNPVIQKSVLQMLCKNTSKNSDMAAHFVALEQYLFRNRIQNEPVLHFQSPYSPGFSLDVSISNGKLAICVQNGSEVIKMQHHESYAELYALGQRVTEIIDNEHVTLAPLPDKKFIDAILSTEEGSVINFNNQIGVVCTKSDGNKRVFKQQFYGDLFNITMDSFTKSDTYIIDTQNPKDLHFLYGKAFSSLTNTADVRVSDQYMGQFVCTDIESKIPTSTSKTIEIGPLKLTAIKDLADQTMWYDGAGNQLDRTLVGTILGWAKNTIPEVGVYDWNTNDVRDGVGFVSESRYNEFLYCIKEYANTKQFGLLIEHAFRFVQPNSFAAFTIDDLEQDENDNFVAVTYAFHKDEKGQHIYKFSYDDGNVYGWPNTMKEITEEEFVQFCEKKYDDTYHSFVNKNERTVAILMAAGLSKNQAAEKIISKIKERTNYDFLGITKSDIDAINEKISLLINNLPESTGQLTAEEFIGLDDIAGDE